MIFLISNNIFPNLIIGTAYKQNQLVYIEKHKAKINPNGSYISLETDYFDKNNVKFASIKSNFNKNLYIPEVDFADQRFNILEKSRLIKNNSEIELTITNKDKITNKILTTESNSILGQGFHNFIIQNFDKLLTDNLEVAIILINKLNQFHFIIKKENLTSDLVIFKVMPKNIFLKVLVDPIILTYSLKDRRLLSFSGISNIDNDKGDSQNVLIQYSYE